MWIFFDCNDPSRAFGLLAGYTYSIGRGLSDISFSKDLTISRSHASIAIKPRLGSGDGRPSVVLEDRKSSFGTYVGELAIQTSGNDSQADRLTGSTTLTDGTRVRFGLSNTIFQLEWRPVVAITSSMGTSSLTKLEESLGKLPEASLTRDWSSNATHLVMNQVVLTLKVVNSLALCIPIVTPNFFIDLHTSAATKQPLPLPERFIPPLSERTLNRNSVSLHVDVRRQELFKGMTFAFVSQDCLDKYNFAITKTQGTAVLITTRNDFEAALKQCEEGLIVIKSAKNTPNSQELLTFLQEKLKAKSLRLIPEHEIGVALLKVSTDVDCNPRDKSKDLFQTPNPISTIQGSEILATETQTMSQVCDKSLEDSVRMIPETLSAPSRKSQDCLPPSFPSSSQQDTMADEELLQTPVPNRSTSSQKRPRPSSTSSSLDQAPPAKRVVPSRHRADPSSPMDIEDKEDNEDLFNFSEVVTAQGAPSDTRERNSHSPSPKRSKGEPEKLKPSTCDSENQGMISNSPKGFLSRISETPKTNGPEHQSFCKIQFESLVVKNRPVTGAYVQADDDLATPIRNVKRFKKQKVIATHQPFIRLVDKSQVDVTRDQSFMDQWLVRNEDNDDVPIQGRIVAHDEESPDDLFNFDAQITRSWPATNGKKSGRGRR